jgi:hypothetical protein
MSRITFVYHAYVGLQHTSWISDVTASWGPAVDVFTLMVDAPRPSAPAPPGGPPSTFSRQWWALSDLQLRHLSRARRRHFHVGHGCSWISISGTS